MVWNEKNSIGAKITRVIAAYSQSRKEKAKQMTLCSSSIQEKAFPQRAEKEIKDMLTNKPDFHFKLTLHSLEEKNKNIWKEAVGYLEWDYAFKGAYT